MANNLYYFKIESLCGEVSDPKFISDVLTDTSSEIINLLDVSYLYLFSKEVNGYNGANEPWGGTQSWAESNNGYKLPSTRILNISKKDSGGVFRSAKEIPIDYEFKVQNADSVFYPSETEPVYFIKNNHLYVYGGSAISQSYPIKVNLVKYPNIAYNDSTGLALGSDSTFTFPVELDSALVYGAAMRVRVKQLNDLTSDEMPTAPSFTQASTYISTDEDIELAGSELSKISAQIQDYTAQMGKYGEKYKNMAQELSNFKQHYDRALQPYIGSQVKGGPTAQAAGGARPTQ